MTSVFGDLISLAAAAEQITVQQFNDGWVHRYTKNGKTRFSYGYQFDLNSGVSQQLATDKCASSELLLDAGISSTIHHSLVTSWVQDSAGKWQRSTVNINWAKRQSRAIVKNVTLPVIVKPVTGTSGEHVYLVKTNEELAKHLLTVVKAHRTAAISQFIPAKAEIRLIMLDNSLLLAYKKTAAAGEWRFNLSKGAVAELLEHSNVDETLVNSAQKALKALGLRVAAVDFLMSSDGPRLLEVNAGIMLNNLAQQGSAQKDIAIQSYRTILQKMFI